MCAKKLVIQLAQQKQTTPAEAADDLDDMIHRILQGLRSGKTVAIPGVGRFAPGSAESPIVFRPAKQKRKEPGKAAA